MPETEILADKTEKNLTKAEVQLNDGKFMFIGVVSFGLLIPNVAGLFGDLGFGSPLYWLGYIYFIGLSYLIWQGNRYLLFRTRKRFTWFDKPMEKLILLFMNNIFYTAPLTIAWLCAWYAMAGFPKTDWNAIEIVVFINVICVLFVTHVYETVFLVKEKESETIKNEQLQRATAEAELAVLKNQVDPHFMFNSLNTLSYLVKSDQNKALLFTENLAEVYRYILMQKDYQYVLLEDELAFTQQYIDLLHLRFGSALKINNAISSTAKKDYLIPPTSVFVAFENAVKHNVISENSPLMMELYIDDNRLYVINDLREKGNKQSSSKIGLKNLNERFQLVTKHGIDAYQENNKFIVSLPLTPLTDNEGYHN
ncbi:hypothetical protein GCM10027429_22210 [Marivirga atlantica]|jgi:hypothetical protein|uniref:Histidine kinase n=1 Tax=Marivirga atlantica TaxID=1548457 RepID=A0A937ALN6_9BACT|nr:sensor histidine kinase [Marivirga atlantica]MBL0765838.1 histidine kinase [Marivirga atlantica]